MTDVVTQTETIPGATAQKPVHTRAVIIGTGFSGLGMAIGEMFAFGDLAAACAREGRYEFMFVAVPLNVTGAVGSPANAVAVL